MKYALTYTLSLEDDLQVENQRETERETVTPQRGEYEYLNIFIYSLWYGEGVRVFLERKM